MKDDVLIKVERVSKKFCRDLKTSLKYGIFDLASEITGKPRGQDLRAKEFWAVDDVSFELKRGECLGLIGRNGAGKTTLLRMLNGLIKPDKGKIEMRGRVGALIALGAGFNPILTGRENIYVNASILGLSKKEIDQKLEEIIDFAEIGDFIDTPVQSYSSGMAVRLGFAIASQINPDILLLDEVLAVGDASFKFKCYRRIDELLNHSAVIFVTHDMPQVGRICNKTLVLNKGESIFYGPVENGIEVYNMESKAENVSISRVIKFYEPIQGFKVFSFPNELNYTSLFPFKIKLNSSEAIESVFLRVDIKNFSGSFVASALVNSRDIGIKVREGENNWNISFSSLPLKPGEYYVNFNISDQNGALIAIWQNGDRIRVRGGNSGIVPDCQLQLNSWTE